MGWGYGLYLERNRGTERKESRELVYWHKFDELWHQRPFNAELDMAYKGIKMSKKDVEALRDIVCTTPDYWATYDGESLGGVTKKTEGFSTIEDMCEIAYNYDKLTEDGWEIIFQAS